MDKNIDIEDYYKNLSEMLDSGVSNFALNNNRAHNAVIQRFILDKSDVVNMYCGEMSVFREGFYKHINDTTHKLGDSLKKLQIESLNNFIERNNTCINIYFENFEERYFFDLIDKNIFKKGAVNGKIHFFKLEDNVLLKKDLSHITYGQKIIRMERDSIKHEATCAINPPEEIMKNVESIFKSMALVGKEVKYPN